MPPRRWTLLPVLLLLLLQPVVSPVVGHGGNGDGHAGATDGENLQDRTGGLSGPQANPVTPNARYVEQRNPDAFKDRLVWQERELGRDWDIMAYNLSTKGPAFPVTISQNHERNPVVRGPWIAWEEKNEVSTDIVVLNTETGDQFRAPDTGHDDVKPTLGDRAVYWLSVKSSGTGVVRGMDLVSRQVFYPAGNSTAITPPSAMGPYVSWVQGSRVEAKIVVKDTRTGQSWSVPDLWAVEEGPVLSPFGVAWIANKRGGQNGVYTWIYNWTEERLEPLRTGKQPHTELGACDTGVMWDQFAGDGDKLPTVAIWDGFTEKIGDFGYHNHDATCSWNLMFYEKELWYEDEDLGKTARIYVLDLRSVRAPVHAQVLMDPGLENAVFERKTTLTGRIIPGDPREALAGLWGQLDGGKMQPIEAAQVPGGYRWRYTVDPDQMFNGQHTLKLIAVDDRGTQTEVGFRFFTSGEYHTNPDIFKQGLNVPREQPSPFPFNLIDHYHDYRLFYNTLGLVLVVLALAAWGIRHWLANRPTGDPEYVRPDPEPEAPKTPQQGARAPQGGSARTFQRL